MKKEGKPPDGTEMSDEYEFSQGARGKCAHRYAEDSNVVVRASDVAEALPDSALVNRALWSLIARDEVRHDFTGG